MDTLEIRLAQLFELAADELDQLVVLVQQCPAARTDADVAASLLTSYSELAEKIGQLAWDCGLEGLQSVCAMFEANLLFMQGGARVITADESAILERWPLLLFDYLTHRADLVSSTALLQSLPMALSEESAACELAHLMGQAITPASSAAPSAFAELLLNLSPQQVESEMLSILASELALLAEQFDVDLDIITSGAPDEQQAALGNFRDFLERIGSTAESVGLAALAALLMQLGQQLSQLTGGLSVEQQGLLRQLPEFLAAYLAAPGDENSCDALALILADPVWAQPIAYDEVALLQGALASVQVMEGAQPEAPRQSIATWQDVSLILSGEVNQELLEGLLQELPLQVGAFTAAIELIASGQGNMKDVERAMRAAHTLKGAANTVGVAGIANLTHHLEDILVALIDASILPPPSVAAILINADDCLAAMSEFLLGLGPEPDHALKVFQDVLDCANLIDKEGVLSADMGVLPVSEPLTPVADFKALEHEAAPAPVVVEQSLRVPAPVVDELLRLAGETLIANSQIQERLRQSISQAEVIGKQNQLLLQLVAELEELVDFRGVTSPQISAAHKDDGLDSLEFEHYSELHTVTRRLIEAATDAQELNAGVTKQLSTLDDLLEEQRRLQISNQHAVMRTRMVTVASVVPRLQRGVRQTGRLLDKQVELVIKGENTNIDSQLLNDLMDPLMHILRNAVDHGIEMPEVRAMAGKRSQGRIELSFSHEGNYIVVRCRDDGAGLDYETIRRIAESRGMIVPGHDYSEDELARQILSPGFSTRAGAASQVSGRGVGLDVVYNRVQEMKGMLSLNSRRGAGFEVELRMPAALLSTHTLIVRQCAKLLAISSRGIEDIRYVSREQIQLAGELEYIREGDAVYELVRLEKLLSLAGDLRMEESSGFPVLLTRIDDGAVRAVLVQEILSSRELVMKNFGRYVPRTQGVIGAVILGDGGTAPVIDLVELLRVHKVHATYVGDATTNVGPLPEEKILTALVVDDSLSARRAATQLMKDAGFEVQSASDGLDAVNLLTRLIPDIMLVDMEMPRMNGLELTAHVRSSERTKHIPVIMITSRTTEKHREMGRASGVDVHLTKPFDDDVLLQHVMRLTRSR
ncbi:MAG: response regulator [Gallionella sp.]|nr:response regulator [Gallionella sp.]